MERRQSEALARLGGGGEKCVKCGTTVYLAERRVANGRPFHEDCFRCGECRCRLTATSFCLLEDGSDTLYCRAHFTQKFNESGCKTGTEGWSPRNLGRERQGSTPLTVSERSASFPLSSREEADATDASALLATQVRNDADDRAARARDRAAQKAAAALLQPGTPGTVIGDDRGGMPTEARTERAVPGGAAATVESDHAAAEAAAATAAAGPAVIQITATAAAAGLPKTKSTQSLTSTSSMGLEDILQSELRKEEEAQLAAADEEESLGTWLAATWEATPSAAEMASEWHEWLTSSSATEGQADSSLFSLWAGCAAPRSDAWAAPASASDRACVDRLVGRSPSPTLRGEFAPPSTAEPFGIEDDLGSSVSYR